ncbi:hypothetical protein PoB_003717700 [Plakobranchus ocellatus]|uniref:Uncharacterized protein n=1 Tax=Plakobranchus ocellatus TaxID=259542 RepID=A0AAV4ATM7_9GAST|nr:hypothetical protein PoB_003717700 [Plakobranchus ocellatus]
MRSRAKVGHTTSSFLEDVLEDVKTEKALDDRKKFGERTNKTRAGRDRNARGKLAKSVGSCSEYNRWWLLLYARAEFTVCPKKLMKAEDFPDHEMALRSAAMYQSQKAVKESSGECERRKVKL